MESMQTLRADLDRARGHWPRIANDTGIDHGTIARIARGDIEYPRVDTFEKIKDWIDANPDFLAASIRSSQAA